MICAISTPAGIGGVAIIRVSGKGCLSLAERVFMPVGKTPVKSFEPNKLYAGEILCEGFTDFGMCVYFKAPKSFTGEDTIELHCHGGTQIARGVLAATVGAGARLAERGEFTKRAFVNGKLSLSSCEGMIDMINAESLAEVRAGGMLYQEKLTAEVQKIQARLKDILAGIAADIDYPEEDIEATQLKGVIADLKDINSRILQLVAAYSGGKYIKSGISVAICGAPNVGKSSLLNALLGYDKAIVSPIAGTTRDVVEGTLLIDGIKFNFTDTAGIREQAGEIEAIGIERAKRALIAADAVICVAENGDFSAAAEVDKGRLIRAFSKTDKIKPFGDFDVAISTVTGEGLEELKRLLKNMTLGGMAAESAYIIEERHHDALKRASQKIQSAIEQSASFPLDLISLDVREAWTVLGEITGETANEEIINTVFEKFCVGK